jgi:hypothetical protein
MIAALVELIRHIQTMRRRGGRAADLEQKPLWMSTARRASSLPFGASICRRTALSGWGKYGASWPVTSSDQRGPEKGRASLASDQNGLSRTLLMISGTSRKAFATQ